MATLLSLQLYHGRHTSMFAFITQSNALDGESGEGHPSTHGGVLDGIMSIMFSTSLQLVK